MKLLHTFKRGDDTEIRIEVSEYRGRLGVNLRTWWDPHPHTDPGDFKPTKKGITLRPDELPELRNAIDQAIEYIAQEEKKKPPAKEEAA